MERLGFRLGDFVAHRLSAPRFWWNVLLVQTLVVVGAKRRITVHGGEIITRMDAKQSLILVSNHRSFFDFFVILAVWFWATRRTHRVLFPVRSTFFYESPLGIWVNIMMSGMAMFPPFLRDRSRADFNRYAIERCTAELNIPGTLLGLHPEGRRNKGDPYQLLRAQPGVGKIALEADNAIVLPIFTQGLTSKVGQELRRNWLTPGEFPIDVCIGTPVDLSDLMAKGSRPATQKQAADRCMAAIQELADFQREHRRSPTPD